MGDIGDITTQLQKDIIIQLRKTELARFLWEAEQLVFDKMNIQQTKITRQTQINRFKELVAEREAWIQQWNTSPVGSKPEISTELQKQIKIGQIQSEKMSFEQQLHMNNLNLLIDDQNFLDKEEVIKKNLEAQAKKREEIVQAQNIVLKT